MSSITVSVSSTYAAPSIPANNVLVIAASKDEVEGISEGSSVYKLLGLTSGAELQLIKAAASRLKPGADSGSAVDFLLTAEDMQTRRFCVAMLPTACARHNTPSKPHATESLVKTNKGDGDLQIVLLPAKNEHAFAQACAACKPFPLYTMKSSANASAPNVDIVVHLPEVTSSDFVSRLTAECNAAVPSIRLAQRLGDAPPNVLHTDAYIEECKAVAAKLGCEIQVIQGKELEAGGFGGIWGVGKASEHMPALVIMSYTPSTVSEGKSVCLVGKGIVYDTGGLAVKVPWSSMAGMKVDMGGSAAVLGAFEAAVTLAKAESISSSSSDSSGGGGLKAPLHALLCIAENSIGPASTRPDDVLTMFSGKTVEVNNPDAEGRLVLADGCAYAAKHLNPGYIIDIATLTGAQLVATGKKHAGVYCNDEELEALGVAAGKYTGDLIHPLPYCPEFYRAEFASNVADMKNSVKDRGNAQSSCAGQFVGNHIEGYLAEGGKWMHIDMAGPSFIAERATGYGVALLSNIVKQLNA